MLLYFRILRNKRYKKYIYKIIILSTLFILFHSGCQRDITIEKTLKDELVKAENEIMQTKNQLDSQKTSHEQDINFLKKIITTFTIKTQIVHEFIIFTIYIDCMNTKVETLKVVSPNAQQLVITLIGVAKLIGLIVVIAVLLGAPVLLNVVTKGTL